MKLTRRQREIYDYLGEFIESNGYAPSLEEIAARFGLSSVATVHEHLENLAEKGAVRRDPLAHSSLPEAEDYTLTPAQQSVLDQILPDDYV